MNSMRWWFKLALIMVLQLAVNNTLLAQSVIPSVNKNVKSSAVTSILAHDVFGIEKADWVFSGVVTNESGEDYHYFFEMMRNQDHFNASALLVSAQNNGLVLHETSEAIITQTEAMQWQVGRMFLRFNSINNSWIFGVKDYNKKGFNFKIDMLGQADGNSAKQQDLRTGLEVLVGQTGRLNGHLQAGNQEEFVTANKAWFRQLWISKPQQASHPFTAILCDFADGSGFYSVNLQEQDAVRGAMAGWRNELGLPVPMSQFVSAIQEKDGLWQIRIPFPKLTFSLKDAFSSNETSPSLAAGAIDGQKHGFCVINHAELG